jgi:hypothetical protein
MVEHVCEKAKPELTVPLRVRDKVPKKTFGRTRNEKKNLRGFSPLANYTDRAIAAGQRS